MLDTECFVQNYSEMASSGVANRIWEKGCLWKQPCAEWINPCSSWQWGVHAVSQVEAPFPERVPWNVGEGLVECIGCFWHLPLKFASFALYVGFSSSSWYSAELRGSHLTGGSGWWFGQWVGYRSAACEAACCSFCWDGGISHQVMQVKLTSLVVVPLEGVA